MHDMGTVDLMITILLVIGLADGLIKGFVRQVISLASLLVGVVAGNMFCPTLAGMFGDAGSALARSVAFLLVFLGVVVAGALVARLLGRLVSAADMGWLNRIAGGVLGAAKCLVLAGVAFNLIESVQLDDRLYPANFKKESFYYGFSRECLGRVMPYLHEFGDAAQDAIGDVCHSAGLEGVRR